jgi:hypothetical protein
MPRTSVSFTSKELSLLKAKAKALNKPVSRILIEAAVPTTKAKSTEVTIQDPALLHELLISGRLDEELLSDLPKSLFEATRDYQSASIRCTEPGEDDFLVAVSDQNYLLKRCEYPNCENALEFQNLLFEEARSCQGFGQPSRRVYEDSQQGLDQKSHLVRAGLIRRRRILYLFPFFRPYIRRASWGVIEYGQHRRVGLLLRSNLFQVQFDRWKTTPAKYAEEAYHWFGGIVDILVTKKKKAAFREGFFQEEIIEIIWSRAQTGYSDDFESSRFPYVLDNSEATVNSEVGLILIDLDEIQTRDGQRKIPEDWLLVEFPHFQNVPVGIGFTLSFLPRLLAFNNWKKLKNKAVNFLKDLRVNERLQQCGIDLIP